MSAEAAPAPLFHSPWGLLDFQARDVARAYYAPSKLANWDTGLGKTILDMATAAMLFEDDLIDLHLLVCEQNKLAEWVADFAKFTDLRVVAYGGKNITLEQRRLILEAVATGEPVQVKKGRKKTDPGLVVHRPQVLISTYETFRNDLVQNVTTRNASGRMVKRLVPNLLTEALAGRRILVGYDEMTKVGNRGNSMHKAQDLLLKHVRKTGGEVRLLGLTATSVDKDPESYYNLGRLLCPEQVGTVKSFDDEHVMYRDAWGNATRFKNLTPDTLTEPWVVPLSTKMSSVLMRKRKTDEDVREQFPEVSERFVPVTLGKTQREFYDAVLDMIAEDEEPDEATLGVLRMIAGHPAALLRSQGVLARAIVSEVGEESLRSMGSAKMETLVERLKPIVLDQGDQAVVFTFFGPSMIPLLAARMREEGLIVGEHYGTDMSASDRESAKEEFRAGRTRVLLSSDAGARGINLPQAGYAFEYEAALTHSNRTQRLNRIHRLNSKSDFGREIVYFQTLVAQDTVEQRILDNTLTRNLWSDQLLGDEDAGGSFISAAMRKRLLRGS